MSVLLANSAFAGLDIFNASSSRLKVGPVSYAPPIDSRRPSFTHLYGAGTDELMFPSQSDSETPRLSTSHSSPLMGAGVGADMCADSHSPVLSQRSSTSSFFADERIVLNSPDLALDADFQLRPQQHEHVLGSPCGLSGRAAAEARPGSVHVDKQRVVNWARPLRQESPAPAQHIFGQSTQRNRRYNRRLPTYDAPLSSRASASSSDDEPLPTTPLWAVSASAMPSSHEWDVRANGAGLGVHVRHQAQGTIHIASPSTSPFSGSPLPSAMPDDSPTLPSRASPSKPLRSSQSLHSYASPSTLADMRQLQRAAQDLELEIGAGGKLHLEAAAVSAGPLVSAPREKRIRRKAVPTLYDLEAAAGAHTSGSSRAQVVHDALVRGGIVSSASGPLPRLGMGMGVGTGMFTLDVAPPASASASSSTSSCLSGPFSLETPERGGTVSATAMIPSEHSSDAECESDGPTSARMRAHAHIESPTRTRTPSASASASASSTLLRDASSKRSLYANRFATMSAIEIPMRFGSLRKRNPSVAHPNIIPEQQQGPALLRTEQNLPFVVPMRTGSLCPEPESTWSSSDESDGSSPRTPGTASFASFGSSSRPMTHITAPAHARSSSLDSSASGASFAVPQERPYQREPVRGGGIYGSGAKAFFASTLNLGRKPSTSASATSPSKAVKNRRISMPISIMSVGMDDEDEDDNDHDDALGDLSNVSGTSGARLVSSASFSGSTSKATGPALKQKKSLYGLGAKGAFMSTLDLGGLRRSKVRSEEVKVSAPVEDGGKGHRRGLSRFFGKTRD